MRRLRAVVALLRYVSLRHALSAPLRSLLVVTGVALGVTMFVGITAANQAVLRSFDDLTTRAGRAADLRVTQDEAGVPLTLLPALRARTELVAHIAPRMERTTFIAGEDGIPAERLLIFGVDFLGSHHFLPALASGGRIPDPTQFLYTPNALIVSQALATRRGVAAGDTLRVRTARGLEPFRVWAVLPDDPRSRAFGGQWAVMSLRAAQFAFGRDDQVDALDIALVEGVPLERAKAELQSIVGASGRVERPGERAEQLARMTRSFQGAVQVQAMVGLLVGVFLIANAVAVSVSQRRREIGVLRSLGVSRRGVALVFVGEAALLGGLGSLLGLVFAGQLAARALAALAPNVSRFYEASAAPEATVSPALQAGGVLLGVGAATLAALGPAALAARQAPVQALRRDLAPQAPWPVGRLAIAGLLAVAAGIGTIQLHSPLRGFVGVGLTLVGAVLALPGALRALAWALRPAAAALFGVPGRLGVDNVAREIGRSAVSSAALVLATGTSLTIATYTHSFEASCLAWIDQAIPADLFVTAGSPVLDRHAVPYAEETVASLAEIPGIIAVNPLRSITLQLGDLRMELQGLDSQAYLEKLAERGGRHVLDGPSPLPPDALLRDGPAIVLSEGTAARLNKHRGDALALPSPTGTHSFEVVAVVVDYSTDQGWGMVDRRWIREFWRDDQVDATDIFLAPGADAEATADAVRRALGMQAGDSGGLFVTTNAELKQEVSGVLRATLGVSRAAEWIALIVAALGVVGTMLAAVIDRTRELGVLRAIGATRGQLLASILAEAGFLGLASALVGALAAVPTAVVMLRAVGPDATGWSIPLSLPVAAGLRTIGWVLACALAAGTLPGLLAARIVVTRALTRG